MGQHVGIGVPVEPLMVRDVYPAQDELAARSKGVHIHSQPRPKISQVVHTGSFRLPPSCISPLRTLLISRSVIERVRFCSKSRVISVCVMRFAACQVFRPAKPQVRSSQLLNVSNEASSRRL